LQIDCLLLVVIIVYKFTPRPHNIIILTFSVYRVNQSPITVEERHRARFYQQPAPRSAYEGEFARFNDANGAGPSSASNSAPIDNLNADQDGEHETGPENDNNDTEMIDLATAQLSVAL